MNRLFLTKDRWAVLTPYLLLFAVPLLSNLMSLVGFTKDNPMPMVAGLNTQLSLGPLPGYSFLDPNIGFTMQALGKLVAEDWLHGIVPYWDPYMGIGMPLAGEMQPAAFFPLVLIFALHNGVLFSRIFLQWISGLGAYLLLRRLTRGASWIPAIGAALFQLNGTFAWLPDVASFPAAILPFVLLGIEMSLSAVQEGSWFGWRLLAVSVGLSICAGFPETTFVNGVLAVIWSVARLRLLSHRYYWPYIRKLLSGVGVGILLSLPALIPFLDMLPYDFLGQHGGSFSGVHLLSPALTMTFIPYIFGPITAFSNITGSPTLASIWANIGGYVSLLLLVCAVLAVKGRHQRSLRMALAIWVLLALTKTFGVPFVGSILNVIPFLSHVAFFRYSDPSWELAIIVLATFFLDDLSTGVRYKVTLGSAVACCVCLVIVILPSLGLVRGLSTDHESLAWVSVSLAWAVISIMAMSWFMRMPRGVTWVSLVLLVDSLGLFIVPQLSNPTAYSIDEPAIHFLESHTGTLRMYTLGPLSPNYGSYFDIPSIDYNALPVPSNWLSYVQKNLFQNVAPATFNGNAQNNPAGQTAMAAFTKNMKKYEEVGVGYVVATSGVNPMQSSQVYGEQLGPNKALVLGSQGVLEVTVTPKSAIQIAEIGVLLGNYGDTANGDLNMRISGPGVRNQLATRSLRESLDNQTFVLSLAQSLIVHSGQSLHIRIFQTHSTKPVAIWVWPSNSAFRMPTIYDGQKLSGMAPIITLVQNTSGQDTAKTVYSDATLQILSLPHPKPLFTFMGSGHVQQASIYRAVVDSTTSGDLVYRELYVPGWHVYVNGQVVRDNLYDGVFQSITLPKGTHTVRYTYVPPHEPQVIWLALLLALTMLASLALPSQRKCDGNKRDDAV